MTASAPVVRLLSSSHSASVRLFLLVWRDKCEAGKSARGLDPLYQATLLTWVGISGASLVGENISYK